MVLRLVRLGIRISLMGLLRVSGRFVRNTTGEFFLSHRETEPLTFLVSLRGKRVQQLDLKMHRE